MYDNYNYPAGADTPAAPWNQIDPPEVDFNVEAIVTLSRSAVVLTDRVYNDDGDICICEDCGASGAYKDNYNIIPDLLAELVKYIDGEMQGDISHERKWELQRLRDSATGWEVIEEEYNCF